MKKLFFALLALCLILAGCSKTEPAPTETAAPVTETTAAETASEPESTAEPVIVSPLPQTINLDAPEDGILAVSLAQGDAYVDDEGAMQMKVTVYTYDLYDLADIGALAPGDILVLQGEQVTVNSLDKPDSGGVIVNGALELRTREDGVYYVTEANDHPDYYALGEAVIRVSPDFLFTDSSVPGEEKTFYPGDFLVEGTGIDYDFTPYNTTIRIENGKVIEMHRIYIP